MKINSRSKSSGQIWVVLLILVFIALFGWWWLDSNKKTMAKEGREFGRKVIQELVVQHNVKFFADHLSPSMRLQYPPSAQQDLMTRMDRLGNPVAPPDVQGDIQFQSYFFEPNGDFQARINYPARSAEFRISVSRPVGRWQIDFVDFTPEPAR
jgi:hypothetical protein